MQYTRRKAAEECRWLYSGGQTTLPLDWSEKMAYIVGLTATDGCLLTGRRKINFKSRDRDLVVTYRALLGRRNNIREQKKRTGSVAYFTEFYDAALYGWFGHVGLTPRKSLTLGGLDVPNQYLIALVRGLLDGDGNIANFVHKPTARRYPHYRYERLWTFFNSASRAHLEWLRARIRARLGLRGRLETLHRNDRRNPMYRLKFGNRDSRVLLAVLYADAQAPRLERKWRIWNRYVRRHGLNALERK